MGVFECVCVYWKTAYNTSFRCRNRTAKTSRSQSTRIWNSHNFAENWPKMPKTWVKMIFPDDGVNIKVVENVKNYLNMQFQSKLMTHSRENGQKPIFWKIAYKKNLRFFGENRASSLFYIYNRLTCCKKSEKSNDRK